MEIWMGFVITKSRELGRLSVDRLQFAVVVAERRSSGIPRLSRKKKKKKKKKKERKEEVENVSLAIAWELTHTGDTYIERTDPNRLRMLLEAG
ncbi:hypothetical protein UVI_02007590 [Ustilaginoidea virens]|uniref:Uncharacterized protein n=1 Tax=Ustilaginoidea virens TaxID=1159556 RepID=A0A1B5KVA0_USTVR|nr:hypothetical protein UVI_02007590 [Ustilaginoidea virens]